MRCLINRFIGLTVFVALLTGTQLSSARLAESRHALQHLKAPGESLLYLPNGKGLTVLSFGYQNILADTIFFHTVSYFGKQYRGTKDYEWFNHMCTLVVSLNPRAEHVYRFCSSLLAWEANQADHALRILALARQQFPHDWTFPYFQGIYELLFQHSPEAARGYFIEASLLPGADPIAARLASRDLSEAKVSSLRIELLEKLIRDTKDPMMRATLRGKLHELRNPRFPLQAEESSTPQTVLAPHVSPP